MRPVSPRTAAAFLALALGFGAGLAPAEPRSLNCHDGKDGAPRL